ncbi:hypothetical protein [Azonexus fungiphilus]|uniref:hypothetical protein n=1 Tax=Azonexus fungiphilus TaxID=146940 RepID=UPI00156B042E|nr:hypothetical protein [Azonexus fungiphilus]NHC07757.1 hypothetical protein [Azonexus fungiphilus]
MCEIDWSATAAWVQAIFSVLAIVAAIWIAKQSADQSRRLVADERKRQADIVASRIAMQLGLFAQELETRASHIEILRPKVVSGQIIQRDQLTALLLPSKAEWITDVRHQTLVFDRDSGIRSQTVFDLIDGARQKIEVSILSHGVLESTPEKSAGTLDAIADILTLTAADCREVEAHLEAAHQLNGDAV